MMPLPPPYAFESVPDHVDEIVRIGVLAAEMWHFDHPEPMTQADRSGGQVRAAIRHLVRIGLLTPCSLDELTEKNRNGIPLTIRDSD